MAFCVATLTEGVTPRGKGCTEPQAVRPLQEFFAMADFVCPGVLSPSLSVFNRVYGAPIKAASDRGATQEQRSTGDERQRCAPPDLLQGFVTETCATYDRTSTTFSTLAFHQPLASRDELELATSIGYRFGRTRALLYRVWASLCPPAELSSRRVSIRFCTH